MSRLAYKGIWRPVSISEISSTFSVGNGAFIQYSSRAITSSDSRDSCIGDDGSSPSQRPGDRLRHTTIGEHNPSHPALNRLHRGFDLDLHSALSGIEC